MIDRRTNMVKYIILCFSLHLTGNSKYKCDWNKEYQTDLTVEKIIWLSIIKFSSIEMAEILM